MPWVYVPEIAPLRVRHIGTSMGTFTQWFVTFIVVKFGPQGITEAGWKFYLLFCVFNVLAIVFVYFCVKETQGKTLEEVSLSPSSSHQMEMKRSLLTLCDHYRLTWYLRPRSTSQFWRRECARTGKEQRRKHAKVATRMAVTQGETQRRLSSSIKKILGMSRVGRVKKLCKKTRRDVT